jgi:hypothetical protein
VAAAGADAPAPVAPPAAPGAPVVGAAIVADESTPRLEVRAGGRVYEPVGAAGARVVVKSLPAGDTPATTSILYQLYDPASGARVDAWSASPGSQDFVTESEGPWVVTVRTGLGLPFPDWSIILRNVETGDMRTVSRSQAAVARVPGVQTRLPTGFAPQPSLSGTRLAWVESNLDAAGGLRRQVKLYDLATGATSVLFDVPEPLSGDAWSVAVRGDIAAWAYRPPHKDAVEIVVHDFVSGAQRHITGVGNPYSLVLSAGGRYLAWDDEMVTKTAMDLHTGARVTYATAVGWGTFATGDEISWTPATGRGGRGGFYNPVTNTIRFRDDTPGAVMNVARVMGPWFSWQELPADSSKPGYYYFLPLRR